MKQNKFKLLSFGFEDVMQDVYTVLSWPGNRDVLITDGWITEVQLYMFSTKHLCVSLVWISLRVRLVVQCNMFLPVKTQSTASLQLALWAWGLASVCGKWRHTSLISYKATGLMEMFLKHLRVLHVNLLGLGNTSRVVPYLSPSLAALTDHMPVGM